MSEETNPLKCDHCGQFIPWSDFDAAKATRNLWLPDSDYSAESYVTLCGPCTARSRGLQSFSPPGQAMDGLRRHPA